MKPVMTAILMIVLWSCASPSSERTQADSSSTRGASTISPAADSAYAWTKLLDSAPWPKSYNFQLLEVRDTLWVFHSDGNWSSTDGTRWTRSPLPNAIYNLAFLDYVEFRDTVYGLGHFEGNIERFSFRPVIYRTADLRHWDSANSNLPARYFYHPFVFNDKLWIIGGEDKQTQYADIWSSPDAIHWTKQKNGLPFGPRANSQVIMRHDTLFLLNNDVWISTNAMDWKRLTREILPGEQVFGYAPEVMDNKLWLIGCNRNGLFSSQVLVSDDGVHWKGQAAPWSPRGGVASALYHGKIYITGGKYGGFPNQPDFRYSNDVWMLSRR
ncbi:MAG TPA: hypothetical protein VHD83_03510 [Puia sp.]|nr:hypothetical protein [Puia sp.]